MDGNGRWAKERGRLRLEGHRAGTDNIRRVIETFSEYGVQYLTIYAFSTENWSRPQREVRGLWTLLGRAIARERDALHKKGIRLIHIGRRDRLARRVLKAVDDAVELTKSNTGLTLIVGLDYGGRAEIVHAVQRIIQSGVKPEEVTEETISDHLYTAAFPDPDLVIRTAGEMRLSNFLTWQSAYAEYYPTSAYWPDFDRHEIEQALKAYSQRERRFGSIAAGR